MNKKLFITLVIVLVVLVAGAVAYYFYGNIFAASTSCAGKTGTRLSACQYRANRAAWIQFMKVTAPDKFQKFLTGTPRTTSTTTTTTPVATGTTTTTTTTAPTAVAGATIKVAKATTSSVADLSNVYIKADVYIPCAYSRQASMLVQTRVQAPSVYVPVTLTGKVDGSNNFIIKDADVKAKADAACPAMVDFNPGGNNTRNAEILRDDTWYAMVTAQNSDATVTLATFGVSTKSLSIIIANTSLPNMKIYSATPRNTSYTLEYKPGDNKTYTANLP